ncbi:hypothetical protein KI688_006276 [Linnemannia hyalina]|uniref:Uncharacterized protein n=1 Tax=Linnemannia hyalina TaxID=64524 RepID=A0A9P8BWX3_9FUNG|nr:hypothetical protein KI688_006276 [Linnemannia hyalina]
MATYKQRTPYQRHTAVYSDEEDTHTVQTSTSNHHTQHHHSHSNHHHHQAEDGILDNTLDREWTSIRNSASARARARQQQYLDQQQQRTREWQFVLSQHRHNSFSNTTTTSRGISSDEYDEVCSAAELSSIVASPCVVDHPTAAPARAPTGEHASVLGFSDLTSDGLESLGESEDLGVWSHEDDDDVLSTPALRRSFTSSSSPLIASTTSLSHIPRPSFADNSPRSIGGSGVAELKFQNQMPFHDGSGNFVERAPSVRESDVESERGWESSSSRTSSVFRAYRRTKETPVRRPISSSEFKAVIQNIAGLQRTSTRSPLVQSSRQKSLEGYASSSTSSRPTFTYPHVVSKRPIFNIYESEMEDLSEMIEVPVKMGWLQAFEQALRTLKPQEYELHADDNAVSPIKAWAQHLSHDEPMSVESRASTPTTVDQQQAVASPSDEAVNTAESQARLDQVQQNMAAASLATLKRLQTRKRANPHHRDPMQIDFAPTVAVDADTYRRNRRVLSRSTGTSTSTSTAHDTNLLVVVLSTLRRFRDHVQSNFMFSEFYGDDERSQHLSRTLGPDGDLGIEWSTGDVGAATRVAGTTAAAAVAAVVGSQSTSRAADRRYRRHERTTSSVVSSSSARSSVRRVNSDCGLESMKSYRSHDSNHPIHSSHYRSSLNWISHNIPGSHPAHLRHGAPTAYEQVDRVTLFRGPTAYGASCPYRPLNADNNYRGIRGDLQQSEFQVRIDTDGIPVRRHRQGFNTLVLIVGLSRSI